MFSWDTTANAPDKDEHDGRSYISAVSEVITDDSQTCRGRAKKDMGEARMDIEDSEMGYLGYHGSESYGLTWKVSLVIADLERQTKASCTYTPKTIYIYIYMISVDGMPISGKHA